MSIRWFKTFLAVSQAGSFAAAAQRIGLTQAAVSTQMSALEEKLRIKLFDRGARTATLNTAGRELASRVPQLIKLYDNIGGGLDERNLGGVLALGSIHHMFAKLLPDALLLLRQSQPNIVVRLCNGVSNDLMRKVELGELDAAIVSQPPFHLPHSVCWHMLMDEPLVLVTPPEAKVKGLAECLATQPFIAISRDSWTGKLTHALFQRHRLKVNEVMEMSSVEAISSMVSRGFGISVVPLSGYLLTRRGQLGIFRLTGAPLSRQVGLIHRSDQAQSAMVFALRDALAASLTSGLSKGLRRLDIGS